MKTLITARLSTAPLDPSAIGRIVSAVGRLRSVDSVTVSVTDARVDVDFDPHAITVEELREVVMSLGYQVRGARVA
ncbi:heavy-metal-associated domain-containing protein [Ornithinimicrobium cryptoxanthini]|uniref:Heavy metal transport/detoxification protein n=1 Tax=Ornithinimicrobium cryptoxanthini TaxID=2934161 RepID=A0ABY4YH20_9MICO|nr:cation transporter [Ornithinimicrobium cryptoxanthini]USQ75904.1 heavy metal transport/detoxification protein [Ornithinimicrobium cryptoxanthini]